MDARMIFYHSNKYLHNIPYVSACEKLFNIIMTTFPGGW